MTDSQPASPSPTRFEIGSAKPSSAVFPPTAKAVSQEASARPAIGVVIPVRNRPASILGAINSVLGQSVGPLAIVVVDDGSSDSTLQEVQCLARRVGNLSVVTIAHSGPATARNFGLTVLDAAMADGGSGSDYLVAFLDSDDVWPPDFLLRAQRRLLERPDLGLVVADRLECFHRSGPKLRSASCYSTDPWVALLRQSPRIMSCGVFRRRILGGRPFPEGSFVGEDAALLIRLLAEGATSARIAGEPVVATIIPRGDQDRLTTRDRSGGHQLRDRIGSAEVYAAALGAAATKVPRRVAGRLLAARWLAVLWHSVSARDRRGVALSLGELRRCGAVASALGLLDQFRVLAGE